MPLRENTPATSGWKGPYMSTFTPDPWGNRYIVEATGFVNDQPPLAWVISAGPNGTFETGRTDVSLQGDDIGILVAN